MYFKFYLIVFFISHIISAQEIKPDSLFFTKIFEYTAKFHSNKNFKKATLFFIQKKRDSTLIYSQRVLDNNSNSTIKNYCYMFRAITLIKKSLYNEAKNQINLISPDFYFINKIKTELAYIYFKLDMNEESLKLYTDIINLPYNELKFINISSIYNDLGSNYIILKNYKKAEFYLKKGLKKEKDTTKLIDTYTNIANLYYQQYKDDIAISYFKKSYKLSSKLSTKKKKYSNRKIYLRKQNTSENMAVVEENRKNYKKALIYRKEMEQWVDSLNDQNKIYAVAKLEKEFAVKEKQKEVNILQVQNKLQETQRNLSLLSVVGLLILLGIGGYFYRDKTIKNKIIAAQKENLDALNATKDKLFSIVSHDLRSSVNALKTSNTGLLNNLASKNIDALESLLQKNGAIVNGAYSLLDNLLNWALLQTEQGYFSIEEMRLFFITEQVSYNYTPLLLEKDLSLTNTVSKKDIVFADQESVKIILRNLIDNAIKFSNPEGSIKIYTRASTDEYCHLIIEDNGLGMSEATRLKLLSDSKLLAKKENEDIIGTGLGMQLCKSMLQKNHGKFAIESELGKGTKMIVSLPKTAPNG